MTERLDKTRMSIRLWSLAALVGGLLAAEQTMKYGLEPILLAGPHHWASLVIATLTSVLVVTLTYAAISRLSRPRFHGALFCLALVLLHRFHIHHHFAPQNSEVVLFVHGITYALMSYALTAFGISCLEIRGGWVDRIPWLAGAGPVVAMIIGALGKSWIPVTESIAYSSWIKTTAIITAICGTMLACGWSRRLKLNPQSFFDSIRLRLPPRSDFSRFYGLHLILAMTVVDFLIQSYFIATDVPTLATTVTANLLTMAILSIEDVQTLAREDRLGSISTQLANPATKRFIARHVEDRKNWAAIVGLRTVNVVIDHDMSSIVARDLPASITQIRSEEIQRCVTSILGPLNLRTEMMGTHLLTTLDPESSDRPEIDALKLCSALYLDAAPLVERRIKGLISLLPIIDPDLSNRLKPDLIAQMAQRNRWFFFIDFSWVDQHVIHSGSTTRYGLRVPILTHSFREAMVNHLGGRKAQRSDDTRTAPAGSAIWLSADAKSRIATMNPLLSEIIDVRTIRSPDSNDSGEVYTIAFEDLIPRLQRYFHFDDTRKTLLDFEPRSDNTRLQHLIGMQIESADTVLAIEDVLSSIASVPWHGFREKDRALELILKAQTAIDAMKLNPDSQRYLTPARKKIIELGIMDAVKKIGYPSQVLHNAHIDKLTLRDPDVLIQVAKSPNHKRFTEAWILLSTTNFHSLSAQDRHDFATMFQHCLTTPKLRSLPIVIAKGMDAVTGLLQSDDISDNNASQLMDLFAETLIDHGASTDLLCRFLDMRMALRPSRPLSLSDPICQRFNDFIDETVALLGDSDPDILALMSRWQSDPARRPQHQVA